jgi:hypothetical protein
MGKSKKYAIFFGFGKESCLMIKRYKHLKPTLVFLDIRDSDVEPEIVKWVAKYHRLKSLIVPTDDKSYVSTFVLKVASSGGEKTVVTGMHDNILPEVEGKFDVIFNGRKREDFSDSTRNKNILLLPEDVRAALPRTLRCLWHGKTKIIFPFWRRQSEHGVLKLN